MKANNNKATVAKSNAQKYFQIYSTIQTAFNGGSVAITFNKKQEQDMINSGNLLGKPELENLVESILISIN